MWIGLIILGVIIVYCVIRVKESSCPNCKKVFGVKEISRKCLREEPISKIEELKRYDKNRNVIGTKESRVYGVRKVYEVTYKCENCTHQWKSTDTEDIYP